MVRSRRLFTFDPEITRDFTLVAWVEVGRVGTRQRVSIVRKPMASDRSLRYQSFNPFLVPARVRQREGMGWGDVILGRERLSESVPDWLECGCLAGSDAHCLPSPSFLGVYPLRSCWGWFLQLSPNSSPQFRFGAHDYYSLSDDTAAAEQVVELGTDNPIPTGKLTHETIVVSNVKGGGGTVTFYRDGALLGTVPLPREVRATGRGSGSGVLCCGGCVAVQGVSPDRAATPAT